MKVALTVWEERISPVFDVSRRILILDVVGRTVVNRTEESIENGDPMFRVRRLHELGINTLICGAISSPLAELLDAHEVHVVSFIAGDVEKVITAYLGGTLQSSKMSMPGCGSRRRRFRGGRGGPGRGGGRGFGKGGRGNN